MNEKLSMLLVASRVKFRTFPRKRSNVAPRLGKITFFLRQVQRHRASATRCPEPPPNSTSHNWPLYCDRFANLRPVFSLQCEATTKKHLAHALLHLVVVVQPWKWHTPTDADVRHVGEEDSHEAPALPVFILLHCLGSRHSCRNVLSTQGTASGI